jgi:chromosome segregation ATPase
MKFLAHMLRIILLTAVIATAGYYASERFRIAIDQKIEWLLPCQTPITYSIGTIDERFGLHKESLFGMIQAGEDVWEKAINKDLFEYKEEDGKVTVNLFYDDRQAATDKLKQLGYVISNDKETYTTLKAKYDLLKSNLQKERQILQNDVNSLKREQDAFEKEVAYWNSHGGAPKDEYKKLQDRKEELNKEADALNQRQAKLNESVDTINSLGTVLNDLITTLNLDVAKYNDNQSKLGTDLDQGEYRLDETGRSINIYQFESREKLERVLAHELGHALGIGHNENASSIMYSVNEGKTLTLSPEDIADLESVCRLK